MPRDRPAGSLAPVSLILDALARAERDKRREAQPLSSMLADAEPAAETSRTYRAVAWRVAGVSIVLFGSLLLAVWLWSSQGGPESPPTAAPDAASAPGAGKRAPRPVASPAEASVPATDTAVPPTGSAKDDSSAMTETRSGDAATSSRPVPSGGAATAALPRAPLPVGRATQSADDSKTRAEVVALYAAAEETELGSPQAEAEAAPDATKEEPVDLETLLREVRRENEVQGLAPHSVPLLSTLSKRFRDSVPTLMYLRHDYNPGGGSTVLLNGDTLRAGGRTRGVEVREVLPDSVICRYQGTDFRLRALNSWVNL